MADKRQQRGQRKEFPVRIFLKTLSPRKAGDVYEVTAVATVVKGKFPQDGVAVQFFVDGSPKDSVVAAENGGRALKRLFFEKEGLYLVEARVSDPNLPGNYVASAEVNITAEKKDPPKPVADLLVRTYQLSAGKFRFEIQPLTESGKVAIGAVVEIFDPALPEPTRQALEKPTDTILYTAEVSQKEKSKTIHFWVIGTKIVKNKTIYNANAVKRQA